MNKSNTMSLAVAALLAAAAAQRPGSGRTSRRRAGRLDSRSRRTIVMANNDLNKDGVITKEEATKAAKQLIQAWDTYDLNKDGKVDRGRADQGSGRWHGWRRSRWRRWPGRWRSACWWPARTGGTAEAGHPSRRLQVTARGPAWTAS